jgi:hypothetical protein
MKYLPIAALYNLMLHTAQTDAAALPIPSETLLIILHSETMQYDVAVLRKVQSMQLMKRLEILANRLAKKSGL